MYVATPIEQPDTALWGVSDVHASEPRNSEPCLNLLASLDQSPSQTCQWAIVQ